MDVIDLEKEIEEKNRQKVLRRKMFLHHCQAWCAQYRHICCTVLNLKRQTDKPQLLTVLKEFEKEAYRALKASKEVSKRESLSSYKVIMHNI